MFLSDLSIRRPILAIVLNLIIILGGITALIFIPVREYPDVENPVVSITTTYPGASPETVEDTITQPIEESLNGLTDIRTITSRSAYGYSSVDVEFKPSRDIDIAATDVNNSIQSTLRVIPESAERPVISKSSANNDAIMWISIQGKNYTSEELSDIAYRVVKPQLQVLPGISMITIGGERKYAMRIWLDPQKMAARNVDTKDVRDALTDNNIQLPGGQVKGKTRQFNILANGQIENPAIYENIVVKKENGIPVYIKDIGYAELGSKDYDSLARYQGEQIVGIGIVKQSKANELNVADVVKNELPKIIQSLPKDISVKVVVDRSLYIKESLKEVFISLIIAIILVFFVTLIFLRILTGTIIISFSIPISIIGSLIGMKLLGFSINVLTMLGMVLAIGIVVDDAIVVLENICRRIENGESRINAAINGSREVGFPVIATTICLVAVFIPLSMLTGTTGKLFREFSIVVAMSILISSFVSLTLIPALSAIFLTEGKNVSSKFGNFFSKITNSYVNLSKKAIKHNGVVMIFLIANLVLSFVLYVFIPKTFVPTEDRGYFLTIVKAPQGSTLGYTSKIQEEIEKEIAGIKEVTRYFSAIGLGIGGPPNPSNGILFASLKHWNDRRIKQQEITGSLFAKFAKIPGALVFPINPPSLGQRSFGKDIEFIIKGSSNITELTNQSNELLEEIKKIKGIINTDSDLLINNPQLEIIFNRKMIYDAGLTVQDVSMSIQSLFSESKLNDFILRNKQYDVVTSLIPKYKSNPNNIKEIYIKGKNGKLLSVDSLISVKQSTAPTQINHYDLQRSVTISASLLPGFALGNTLDEINKISKKNLKPGFSTALSGISREYSESSTSLNIIFLVSIIFIYLILSAVFESFVHPFIVILSVPLAIFGAFITLFSTMQSLNIYSQIGIILLLGIVTKNSILIVDYANNRRSNGMSLTDAVIDSCRVRFRPILMTSITMIFGTLPFLFASGAGAESRFALGSVIVGGATFSTLFTLFVIPVVYIIIVKIAEKLKIKTV